MEEFSTNGMGLHLSDSNFDNSDYIREISVILWDCYDERWKTKVIDAHLLSFVRHETEVGSLVVYEGDQEEEFVPSRTYFV